jgi:hypothetical protein
MIKINEDMEAKAALTLTGAWQHSDIRNPKKDQVAWNFAFPNVHLSQLPRTPPSAGTLAANDTSYIE